MQAYTFSSLKYCNIGIFCILTKYFILFLKIKWKRLSGNIKNMLTSVPTALEWLRSFEAIATKLKSTHHCVYTGYGQICWFVLAASHIREGGGLGMKGAVLHFLKYTESISIPQLVYSVFLLYKEITYSHLC